MINMVIVLFLSSRQASKRKTVVGQIHSSFQNQVVMSED